MTVFYLVRHGDTGVRNHLSGRTIGVHLNETGREQAELLADRLSGIDIDGIYSSPLERAVETAQPTARDHNLSIQITEAVSEIDYGDWTGNSFDEIFADPLWRSFNIFRSGAQIPGGENIMDVQHRFVAWMEKIRRERPADRIVVVSHQDPIKTAVAYYAGLHIDMFARFEIQNASVTVMRIDDHEPRLLTLNNVGALPL